MKFTDTPISGAHIIDLDRKEDHRGFFARAWCQREFADHDLNPRLVQVNIGYSHSRGTVRGLHYQLYPHQEAKLVRCTMGAIYDVLVDLRPDSPTYKKWFAAELTAENRLMVYIPEGCAHGYQTLAPETEMYYQTSQFYVQEYTRGIRYDDPAFGITWPLPITSISEGDQSWPDFLG